MALLLEITCAQGDPALSTVSTFGSGRSAAAAPCSELIVDQGGVLYGTTPLGGSTKGGTVFRINQDGSDFRVLKSFGETVSDGKCPLAAVIGGSDGSLYGTTREGGQFGYGTVFRLSKDGTNFSILKSFAGTDGAHPEARLLLASDGWLYGTTAGGGGTNDYGVVFRVGGGGSGFNLLFTFAGTNNGANPEGGLIEAADGRLYGTTYSGGTW